jgi:hypothetical protein
MGLPPRTTRIVSKSKRRTVSLLSAVCAFILLGTVACKQSETSDGSSFRSWLPDPARQRAHRAGSETGQAPDMPENPNSR